MSQLAGFNEEHLSLSRIFFFFLLVSFQLSVCMSLCHYSFIHFPLFLITSLSLRYSSKVSTEVVNKSSLCEHYYVRGVRHFVWSRTQSNLKLLFIKLFDKIAHYFIVSRQKYDSKIAPSTSTFFKVFKISLVLTKRYVFIRFGWKFRKFEDSDYIIEILDSFGQGTSLSTIYFEMPT